MVVRKAESQALQQSIYINLDDIRDFDSFMVELALFDRVGNGQMLVNPVVFKGKSDKEIRSITELARKSGVKICVVSNDKDKYMKLGFAGFYDGENIYDFVAKPEGDKADEISDFKTPDDLRTKLAGSSAAYKIVKWSGLKGLLVTRSILDRVAIGEILKTSVLSLYNPKATLTKTYVQNVGYNFDRNIL